MDKEKLQAKKSLGQHFLTDTNILKKIIDAGDVTEGDYVLEIGPGRGALTESLLERGASVLAIEKDEKLVVFLNEKFEKEVEEGRLVIHSGDILLARDFIEKFFENKKYKVVANIPYYITGKILRFLFSLNSLPLSIVLLVQLEVAKRIVSEKESLLSLSVKTFATPRYRGKVKAGSFSPAPKVDSAILSIENISRDYFKEFTEKQFFTIIRQAFSQKRKTLLNTLFMDDKLRGKEMLETLNLKETTRPEEHT